MGGKEHRMTQLLLVVHIVLTILLIGVILLQKSEGGALGIGGGGMGGLFSSRGQANLLTRTTAILAILFFASSFGLAWVAYDRSQTNRRSIMEQPIEMDGSPSVPLPAGGATPGETPMAPNFTIPQEPVAPAGGGTPASPEVPVAPVTPAPEPDLPAAPRDAAPLPGTTPQEGGPQGQ